MKAYAYLEGYSREGLEVEMTIEQAESVSHPGPCDSDVYELMQDDEFMSQFESVSDERLSDVLYGYGAWSDDELESREDNLSRVIWQAGCFIIESENWEVDDR